MLISAEGREEKKCKSKTFSLFGAVNTAKRTTFVSEILFCHDSPLFCAGSCGGEDSGKIFFTRPPKITHLGD